MLSSDFYHSPFSQHGYVESISLQMHLGFDTMLKMMKKLHIIFTQLGNAQSTISYVATTTDDLHKYAQIIIQL